MRETLPYAVGGNDRGGNIISEDEDLSRSVARRLRIQRTAELLEQLSAATNHEITWESFGGGFPVQGEGRTASGEHAYFRFRHNSAQLYVGYDPLDSTSLYSELDDVFLKSDGTLDEQRGLLGDDEAVALVERLFFTLDECDIHETRRARLTRFLENMAAQAGQVQSAELAPPTSTEDHEQ